MSRARMLADFLVPLTVILTINTLILSLMTALDPVMYGIAEIQPSSPDDVAYESSCIFTDNHRHQFWIPLVCWNISVLAFALYQSWSARNFDLELSTRFPSEGPQIFNALLSSLLVSLVGIAVMLIVRDDGNPTLVALVEGVIVFVFCVLVLWSIFGTKAKHVWKTTWRQHDTTDTDDSRVQERINRTNEELKVENDGLRKRNLELEEELILYPTTGRSVNKILRDFFGKLLGSEDGFDDYAQAPSVEMSIEQKHKKKEKKKEQQQQPPTDAVKPASFTLRCKKIVQDICVYPSDLFQIFPPGIRIDPTYHPSDMFQIFPPGIRIDPTDHRMFYINSTTSTSNDRNNYNNGSNNNTQPNKSSPGSNGLGITPTMQSDLRPNRSSYYSNRPSRGPEPEDESTAPLETKKRSFGSTAVLVSPEQVVQRRNIFRPRTPLPPPLMGDVSSPASLHYLMGGGVSSPNTGNHHIPGEIPEGIPRDVLIYPTDWLQNPQQQQRSPTGPRRPSLGFDVDIQPDLRMEYRHCV